MLGRLKRLYTIKGRTSRLIYWKNTLYVGILQIAILFGLVFLGTVGVSSTVLIPVAVVTGAATFLYLLTVAIRRLHDRNKGAIVWLAYLVVPNVLSFAGKAADAPILNVLAGLMGLWVIIDIGFLSGTHGDNVYGPDPRDEDSSPDSASTAAGLPSSPMP